MAEKKPVAPVDPDGDMIPEGSLEGGPSVRFCAEKRAHYHLNIRRERVYHGVPEGFAFNDAGELLPVGE